MNGNKTRFSINFLNVIIMIFCLGYSYLHFVDDSLLRKIKVKITFDEKNESIPTLKPAESNKVDITLGEENKSTPTPKRRVLNKRNPKVPEYHYTKLANNNELVFAQYSIHYPSILYSHEAMQVKLVEMAEAGNPEAEYRLGSSYELGTEIEKDPKKALSLFKSAAIKGHSLALGKIGYMFATGSDGHTRDLEEAAKWYFIQQIFAPDERYGMFKEISLKLSGEQLAIAKQKANQWVREDYRPSNDIKNQVIDFPSSLPPKNSCNLFMIGGHTCSSDGQIKLINSSTIHNFTSYLLEADLSPNSELTELKIEIGFDDEHEWLLNIGNSNSNDGYSGDFGTQSRDSELQIKGNVLSIFGSDHTPAGSSLDGKKLLFTQNNFIENNKRAVFIIRNNYLYWESKKLGKCGQINSPYLFSLNGQNDTEGAIDYSLHIGVQRTITNLQRNGVGVKWVRLTMQEANSNAVDKECSSVEIL